MNKAHIFILSIGLTFICYLMVQTIINDTRLEDLKKSTLLGAVDSIYIGEKNSVQLFVREFNLKKELPSLRLVDNIKFDGIKVGDSILKRAESDTIIFFRNQNGERNIKSRFKIQ